MSLLCVHSLGVSTSELKSADQLMARVATATVASPGRHFPFGHAAGTERSELTPALLENLDPVSRLAFAAIAQAWHGANLHRHIVPTERIALLFCSAWGQVDSTIGYLESMWAEQGRYASPRQFTRSVHSSPTSLAAIEFGIHGPCETLVHDAWPVCSVLDQAEDLLRSGHADAAVVCWADQASSVAAGLCRRAVRDLHRSQFSRFSEVDRHCGAVAAVVSCNTGLAPQKFRVEVGPVAISTTQSAGIPVVEHGAYPTDGALHWASAGMAWSLATQDDDATAVETKFLTVPNYWREIGHHGQMRKIKFCRTKMATGSP